MYNWWWLGSLHIKSRYVRRTCLEKKKKRTCPYLIILQYNLPAVQLPTSTGRLDASDDEIAPAGAVLLFPLLGLALPDGLRSA